MNSNQETKLFVSAILGVFKNHLESKILSDDSAESLEVLIQVLRNAYGLEDSAEEFTLDSNAAKHVDLFELFTNSVLNVSEDRKSEAEALKNEGNNLMKLEKYHEAINFYNRAINIDATNPVFYCNRAAAYTKIEDIQKAIDDCKMSLRYDPNYVKAHGRLGLAYTKANRYAEAIESYEKALKLDPNNMDYQINLKATRELLKQDTSTSAGSNNIPSFAEYLNNPDIIRTAMNMLNQPGVVESLTSMLGNLPNTADFQERGRAFMNEAEQRHPEFHDLLTNLRRENQDRNQTDDSKKSPEK